MNDAGVQGFCDERFAPVAAAFEKNLRGGLELGASFALALEGRTVVDLWAGHADAARTRAWREDTIANVYSNAKILTALCGLMVVDRGLVELDAPVARYWPEFGAAGKSGVLVRHLFCHASGVPGLDSPIEREDLTDWDRMVSRLAAQQPWWEPGTASGYHALSFSFLIGELVRRATGVMPDRFLRDEVALPSGADVQFGLRDGDLLRLADTESGGRRDDDDEGSLGRRVSGAILSAFPLEDPVWRSSLFCAFGNARSLVKVGSILAGGGCAHGRRFLSEATARLAYREQLYTEDLVMGMPVRFGLGFGLASKEFPLPFANAFHWGGYGGSSTIMEPDSGACWSYVPTRLDPAQVIDERGARLNAAAAASVRALG